jgi:thiol:disulfide interchange protein
MRLLIVLTCVLVVASCARDTQPAPAARSSGTTASTAVKFDPARDPARDLEAAIAEATRTKRRIILDVGGEWCSWCHILDGFIDDHEDVKVAVARDYVWLKINFSPENENAAFLASYPKIPGYPHLFVLETDGTLLHSQDTVLLEEGKSYNLDKVREFLVRWARR